MSEFCIYKKYIWTNGCVLGKKTYNNMVSNIRFSYSIIYIIIIKYSILRITIDRFEYFNVIVLHFNYLFRINELSYYISLNSRKK